MEEFSDEIVLLGLCSAWAIGLGNPFSIAGFLMAIAFICLRRLVPFPGVALAEGIFCIAVVAAPGAFGPFLPLCTYGALQTRPWCLRLLWLIPLGILAFLSPSMILPTALLCFAAGVLAIRDVRQRSQREGFRFGYDTLRENNLSLSARIGELSQAADSGATPTDGAQVFSDLTERELAVARLVAEGMDNREIAACLFLSEGTVRNHISAILAKKGFANRTQIAVAYYRGEQSFRTAS